jgi:enoyl-CoA hydratase/carnithine racemase
MNEYEQISYETSDGVAIITLNRPEVLNAMSFQLNSELHDAVLNACKDDAVGCLVVTGAGERAFSAGGDIHEQRADDKKRSALDRAQRATIRSRGGYEISSCPKPIIGMMNGLAYGGGAVLASSLDIRIGCERTRFRFLAAAYGRINSTWTLPNQVGWPMAKELLFSARVVEAEEAYRIGLLNHLVPSEKLYEKTMELARTIAANDTPSVMGIKRLLLEDMGKNLAAQWANEADFGRHVIPGAKAEDAFPDFIKRKGRALS